jgi:hypothetical protein
MKTRYLAVALLTIVFVLGLSLRADAGPVVRGEGTSPHGTYRLIYDDVQDLTWYDYTTTGLDRRWPWQRDWALNLSVDFGGTTIDDWRLPVVEGCYYWNCTDRDGELATLYYDVLGNASGGPLTNVGPFQNLHPTVYWTGTERLHGYKYTFNFSNGRMDRGYAGGMFYAYHNAIAVRSGDVGAGPSASGVPLPAAAWMGLGLLAVLGAARRLRRRR